MKELETDVVVIAAGTAGLTATVTAAEAGARVILFERASTTGGTGAMSLGIFAVESKIQRQRKILLSKEQAFKAHMDYTHWRVDARLVQAYYERSASTIDWLMDKGVEFDNPDAYYEGSNFTQHTVSRSAGGCETMMRILTERAQELGVQLFLRTPVKKILKEGGRITGVVAEDESGEEIRAKSKAVIVATGGFGDNPEMIKKYTGYEYGRNLFSVSARNLQGDGIRMAWEVGAGQEGLNMELIYLIPGFERLRQMHASLHQPNLMVNVFGERFMNEEIMGNTTFTGNAVSRQKDRCAFNIFNDAIKDELIEKGLEFTKGGMYIDNVEEEFKEAIEQGHENVFVADSIEELAEKTGINLEGLRKTIDEYNVACETGRDRLFYKNPRYLRPIRTPKYYAGRIYPTAYGSLGGIKINHKTEALTDEHEVIPGLYAAGTDACSIYGDSYVIILPGNTMGFAINSGRIAGENAAAYVQSVG